MTRQKASPFGRRCFGASRDLSTTIEDGGDLVIGHLVEIGVVEADRAEAWRGLDGDHLVGEWTQLVDRLRCSHRCGQHQPCGVSLSRCLERDAHRRAGRDPVIDDDRGSACDVDRRAPGAVNATTPLQLFKLARGLVPDVVVGDVEQLG